MCDTSPTGSPTNDTLMLSAECGQHWCVVGGVWKAVSRVRFVAELEVQRLKRETEMLESRRRQELLLGPDNVKSISAGHIIDPLNMAAYIPELEETSFCPGQDDWPQDAPWYYTAATSARWLCADIFIR